MRFDFTGRMQAAFGFIAGAGLARAGNKLARFILGDARLSDKNSVFVWDDNAQFDEVVLRYAGANTEGLQKSYNFSFESINSDYSTIFATPPMMTFSRGKRLTITPIDNTDTEVIERYATEPYSIEWRGLLIDMENHNFPIDKMRELNKIFQHNDIFNVDSEICQALEIHSVFVQNLRLEFVEGYEDTISYTMTLRAIKPLEYQLLN